LPGILTALATFAGAIGGLIAALAAVGLVGGSNDTDTVGEGSGAAGAPVVARLERGEMFVARAFFAPKGMLLALDFAARQPGLTVVWTEDGSEKRARVESVTKASFAPAVARLTLDAEGPKVDFPIRNASSLREGDRVEAYLGPGQQSPATVLEVAAQMTIAGAGELDRLLVTTQLSGLGEAGVPVRDQDGKVVAMLIAADAKRTISGGIEDIRTSFPDAF
jgi:hypothetical protein